MKNIVFFIQQSRTFSRFVDLAKGVKMLDPDVDVMKIKSGSIFENFTLYLNSFRGLIILFDYSDKIPLNSKPQTHPSWLKSVHSPWMVLLQVQLQLLQCRPCDDAGRVETLVERFSGMKIPLRKKKYPIYCISQQDFHIHHPVGKFQC